MAYNTEDLKKKALDAIDKYKLIWMDEVPPMIGISLGTFYNHKLQELEEVKEAITLNRVHIKISQRKKWHDSENATLQIALAKLVGTEEEVHRLNGSRQEIKQETTIKAQPKTITAEEAQEYLKGASIG